MGRTSLPRKSKATSDTPRRSSRAVSPAASDNAGEGSSRSTRRRGPVPTMTPRKSAKSEAEDEPEDGTAEWFEQRIMKRSNLNASTTSESSRGDSVTPDTSIATTPAALSSGQKRKRQSLPPARQRQKVEIVIDVEADEKLALALQAEEYEQALPKKKTASAATSFSRASSVSSVMSVLSSVPSAVLSQPGDIWPDSDEEDDDYAPDNNSVASADVVNLLDSDSEAEEVDDEMQDAGTSESRPAARASRARGARTARGRRRRSHMSKSQKDWVQICKHHEGIETMWDDLEASPVIPTVRAPQPLSISRQLKPFQLEGLNWMIEQEKTKYKGGLLGDEMGMGKTIQAVSLIMSDYPAKDPTLVVVPPVALMQWQNEINDYTNGVLKIFIYHGTKARKESVKSLRKYNVIMTTYSGLESMYRKEQKGWVRGDSIVKEDSTLHSMHFHRIILDEAHSIKTRTSNTSKACFALQSTYRWCLSGTPLQNRIGELFSLLRFIEVDPFAYYLCKKCDCKSIHWNMVDRQKCNDCGHSPTDHVSLFNRELLDPIQRFGSMGEGREAFKKLRILNDRIMLRRVKKDHVASMELPAKDVVIVRNFFGEVEQDLASSIMTNTTRKFENYVTRGVMLNNYANIFGLIMQMRQIADHPDLLLKRKAEGGENVLVCEICDDMAEDAIRAKCHHVFCRKCVKNYIENYEGARTMGYQVNNAECPRCHVTLSIDLEQPEIEQDQDEVKKSSIVNRIKMENWTSSTKIEMLVAELAALRSRKQTAKSIIFSQFTSMLQLIEWRLHRAGLQTVMLDGSMTPAQRAGSIKYFMENVGVDVFLVSLKAGGVALNLTEASKVYIVDPWWNPAAEWQSADRCHRIGQGRPCQITRLCIEDSVESRIILLQEKKARMINGTINRDETAISSLTPEDMQFLFRGS